MNGFEALALTLTLVNGGMDPSNAADLALDTMHDINRMQAEDERIERETARALAYLNRTEGVNSFADAA